VASPRGFHVSARPHRLAGRWNRAHRVIRAITQQRACNAGYPPRELGGASQQGEFDSVHRPQHESNRALYWIEETAESWRRDIALDIAFSRCSEEVVHLDSTPESVLPHVPLT
jgi:hypothetical protein